MKIVDMHCDTIVEAFKTEQTLKKNKMHIDIKKLKKGNFLLQNMAIFLDSRKDGDITNLAKDIIRFYNKQTTINSINRVYKYDDIKMDKINSLLTIEDSDLIPIDSLNEFYDLGVRMIGLTWNYKNRVGFPNIDGDNYIGDESLKRVDNLNGLTSLGIKYVKKMEELNIIVDVSHGSNRLVEDVLNVCKKPFVASHSNCYSVTPVGRNLSDELILKMINKQCVIGINFCSPFLTEDGTNHSRIDDIIKHIDHIISLGGEDSVGFGADLDGINSTLEIKNASNMQQIIKRLNKRYSASVVKKISHENVLSLYQKILV